ncbi:MAG: rhamnulokinase [Treponema sp.]|nr:rhamnulokinase [Treponema sp.]
MKVLAIDLGASGGCIILGEYDRRITLTEIHRFENIPIEREGGQRLPGHLHWDIDTLFDEIKTGIKKCVKAGHEIESISIDTWGCDFALIDSNGSIIHSPLHYRDKLTEGYIMNEVFEIIPKEILYKKAGIEFMRFNTIFQLYALKKLYPKIFINADKILFMPDLFAFLLTGKTACEYTIASTSGLINLETKQADAEVLNKLGIKPSLFSSIRKPGTVLGNIKSDLALELGIPQIKVITGAGHDTADAAAAAPLTNAENCFISCGTWSLLGTESLKPITSDDAFHFNFTNEGGYNDRILFLKNISGLWLLQESRRQWEKEGELLSFSQIGEAVAKNISPDVYLDAEREEFGSPGNLPLLFNKFFEATGQRQLTKKTDIAQCILESLALSYDLRIRQLEQITGKHFPVINIIGGGTQDKNLMQYTANATGKNVIAGPVEATALGNIMIQLICAGTIKNTDEGRKQISDVETYISQDKEIWKQKRKKYTSILKS